MFPKARNGTFARQGVCFTDRKQGRKAAEQRLHDTANGLQDSRDILLCLWQTVFVTTLHVDTGTAVNRLVDSGLSKQQAEAVVETFKDVDVQQVATKEDVHRLELQVTQLESRVLRWALPLLMGQAAVFAAIVKWME